MKILLCFSIVYIAIFPYHVNAAELTADASRLKSHVRYLSDISPPRNINHIESLEKASEYIEDHFKKYSDRVESQFYHVDTARVRNIIASFGPKSGPRIIIGAHYDVAGDQPGADDNASGVAGVLELALLLSNNSNNLPFGTDLIAYTLEEHPYFRTREMGSYIHAKSLHDKNIIVELMVSLEMIGYYLDDENSQTYPIDLMKFIYPSTGNFISIISNFNSFFVANRFIGLMERKCQIKLKMLAAPEITYGVDLSDHLNYWTFGYKAIMITDTSFMRNNNYHKISDTPETLNYEKMAEVVNGVYYATVHY